MKSLKWTRMSINMSITWFWLELIFKKKIKEDNNVTKMEFDEMVSFFLEKKISFEIAGYIDEKIIKRVIKENHLIYDGDKVNNKKFENDSYYVAVSDLEDINKYNIL